MFGCAARVSLCRAVSIIRRRATVRSHPSGLVGMPSASHWARAAAKARTRRPQPPRCPGSAQRDRRPACHRSAGQPVRPPLRPADRVWSRPYRQTTHIGRTSTAPCHGRASRRPLEGRVEVGNVNEVKAAELLLCVGVGPIEDLGGSIAARRVLAVDDGWRRSPPTKTPAAFGVRIRNIRARVGAARLTRCKGRFVAIDHKHVLQGCSPDVGSPDWAATPKSSEPRPIRQQRS